MTGRWSDSGGATSAWRAHANAALAGCARAPRPAQLREQWLLLVQTVVAIFPGCAQRLATLRDTLPCYNHLLHLQDRAL